MLPLLLSISERKGEEKGKARTRPGSDLRGGGDTVDDGAGAEAALACLPDLDEGDVYDDAGSDDTPLPSDGIVLEDNGVDLGEVDNGKGDEEAGNDGEEEEPVVPDGAGDGERAPAPQLRVHVEQRAREVLDLPGGDQEQEAERGVRGGTRAVHDGAGVVEVVVALVAEAERSGGLAVDDRGEGGDTERAHEEPVGHLVNDDFAREHAHPQIVRRPQHDVRLRLLEPQSQRQERRRNQVGPQDLDGRQREYRLAALVLECEAD